MRKNYYINWFPSRNSNYSLQFAYFSLDYIKEKKEVKVESKLQIISPLNKLHFPFKKLQKEFFLKSRFSILFQRPFLSCHGSKWARYNYSAPRAGIPTRKEQSGNRRSFFFNSSPRWRAFRREESKNRRGAWTTWSYAGKTRTPITGSIFFKGV